MNIRDSFKISYAQNREDIFLEAFFPDQEKGVYVDIGANHPVRHSVTKIFYDKGWRGVNVEPNPELFELIQSHRPEDKNVNIGLADKPGRLDFRIYHSRDGLAGLSTFSESMKDDYSTEDNVDTGHYEDISVEVTTLEKMLEDQGITHIDFMKIDVEGFEYEVIKGNNWKKYRPELICIESNHVKKDWRVLLEKSKYKVVFNDGLNDYLLADEASDRLKVFDYAKAFLLGLPVINSDMEEAIATAINRTDELEKEVQAQEVELEKSKKRVDAVSEQRNKLFADLEQYSTVRGQLFHLFIITHKRILFKLERIREPKKKKAPKMNLGLMDKLTIEDILRSTQEYDERHLTPTTRVFQVRHLLHSFLSKSYYFLIATFKLFYRSARFLKRKLRH